MDVAIRNGRIASVAKSLPRNATQVLDTSGLLLVPGLIDMHVHLSSEFSGHVAHAMLARAGVTVAMDMAGPVDDVLNLAAKSGAGIQVACLQRIKPGEMVESSAPPRPQISKAIDKATRAGAIGVKILGGHYPLTPDATSAVIEEANRQGAYVAFHCGTTETPGDFRGFVEALELKRSNRVHLAHINSYCRGATAPPVDEALKAATLLKQTDGHVICESYVSPFNGTWGRCKAGKPESDRTTAALVERGYPPTALGLEKAIREEYCRVHVVEGQDVKLLGGEEGVRIWRSHGTDVGVSFHVNPLLPQVLLACIRDKSERFIINALATDGGGIPRNNAALVGMNLVRLGLWSRQDFVAKTSIAPATILGMRERKGHLSEGADADVTGLDPISGKVQLTVSMGQVIAYQDTVVGRGSIILTTKDGTQSVAELGLPAISLNLYENGFYGS